MLNSEDCAKIIQKRQIEKWTISDLLDKLDVKELVSQARVDGTDQRLVEKQANSIKIRGFEGPLLSVERLQDGTCELLDGNHRYRALKSLVVGDPETFHPDLEVEIYIYSDLGLNPSERLIFQNYLNRHLPAKSASPNDIANMILNHCRPLMEAKNLSSVEKKEVEKNIINEFCAEMSNREKARVKTLVENSNFDLIHNVKRYDTTSLKELIESAGFKTYSGHNHFQPRTGNEVYFVTGQQDFHVVLGTMINAMVNKVQTEPSTVVVCMAKPSTRKPYSSIMKFRENIINAFERVNESEWLAKTLVDKLLVVNQLNEVEAEDSFSVISLSRESA